MAAPTNPFAAALEEHKEGHNPHNPFASPPSTNPFLQTTSEANAPQAHSHEVPAQQQQFSTTGEGTAPHSVPPTNEHESASHISQQLSGLDFGDGSYSQPPGGPEAQHSSPLLDPSAPADSTAPSAQTRDTAVPSFPTPSQPSNPAPEMTTTYAPPPGPPPGHYGNGAGLQGYPNPGQHAYSQNPVSQAESDEAYARQLLAEDEERVRRRQQRRQARNTSNGANQRAPSDTQQAPTSQSVMPAAPRPRDPNEEKQWNTKEIFWRGRIQRIITQNENGPCSLIALCNVLLLRETLTITPEDRPAVSYSYLSSLLGEHLIDVISTSGSDNAMDLGAALSILPQTQTGLDVNVCFASIHDFSVDEPSPAEPPSALIDLAGGEGPSAPAAPVQLPNAERLKQRGELALFKLCNVPLVHGWLADEDDKETWEAVVERTGDYDKALDRVVAGDELAKGTVVEGAQARPGGSTDNTDGLTSEEAKTVKDAVLIRNFLESTATQLTYPGLYALSTQLQRGTPYALFRNSHLSVIYRPTEEELRQAVDEAQEPTDAAQPQLYQLVTDSMLESEDSIAWESVEDVDGSASRFYDAKFRQSRVQDFVGRSDASRGGGQADEDADFAFAQQLQDQESRRARQSSHRGQQRGARPGRAPFGNPSTAPSSNGNVISRMLAARKSGKRAPSSNARLDNTLADDLGGQPSTTNQSAGPTTQYSMAELRGEGPGAGAGQEYAAKKDKWYKKIF